MSVVVAYVTLHSRHSSRSLPDASPGRYSSGRPHRGQSGSRSSKIRSATWSSDRRRPRARCRAAGTGPSRTSASSRRATSASLHPSPPSVDGVQRVELVGREDVAPGVRETPGRREETTHEHLGSEQRPHGVEGLGERVRSITSRSCGAYRTAFRADAADPLVAFEAVAIRGVQRPHQEALHQRAAGVVRRRPSPGRRDDGGEVVVVDDEAEPPRPQLDARPRRPLVRADRSGEDVDHAEVALDRGRRGRVDLRHRDRRGRDPPASRARPCPRRATGRRPRRTAGTSSTGPTKSTAPARWVRSA